MNPDVISANKAQLQVPLSWQIRPLKSVASFRKGLSILKTDLSDEGVRVISYGQIHDKDNTGVKLADGLLRYIPQELTRGGSCARLRYGDLVFADTSEDLEGAGNAAFVDTGDEVFAGYHTVICRLHDENVLPKFLAYVVNSECWRSQVRRQVSGVKVFSITRRILSSTFVQFPAYPEQQRIVQLLDVETAKIDQAMSLLRRELETLEQFKKSVIHEAVTKGLDPTVPMKPSGVEWIGEIPEHWDVKRLKYLCKMNSGTNLTSEEISETGDYPVYGGNGIRGYYSKFNNDSSRVLVGRQGALCGNVQLGVAPFWATDHAVVVKELSGYGRKYAFYALTAMNLNRLSTAAAQPGLSVEKIICEFSPVPPSVEQESVASALESKVAGIEAVLEMKHEQLEILKQQRQSVIFEYVTGKRRVNGVA